MRLPSISQIISETTRTVSRFPFSTTAAVVASITGIILIDRDPVNKPTILFPIILGAVLGFFLLTALVLISERLRLTRPQSLLLQAAGAVLVVLYAFSVPTDLYMAPAIYAERFAMLLIGLGFFLMVAPFWRKGELNGFWQYNKTIFLRALMSGLFAGVLFAGLAIALAALENLFNVEIPGKRYPELWTLITGLFATTFFLSGIPENLESLDKTSDYPKGLRIFAQYVLMTLVVVYFAILYAYVGKILIEWNWPKGWVAELILGFTVTGVISLVLLYPMREQSGYGWLKKAWNWFYILLIPLTIVLFLAINRRISDYGITEERYIVLVFGVWLSCMIAYFLISKVKSIKLIPATLCFLAVGLSFGPWGVFCVSESSQVGRLQELLSKNEILVDGKVQKAPNKVPVEDSRQISSIVTYLRNSLGLESIQPWFAESLRGDTAVWHSRYKNDEDVVALMGVSYYQDWRFQDQTSMYLTADVNKDVTIAGYDHAAFGVYLSLTDSLHQSRGELHYQASKDLDTLRCWLMKDGTSTDSAVVLVRPIVDTLAKGDISGKWNEIPPDLMIAHGTSRDLQVMLCLRSLSIGRRDQTDSLQNYSAFILYSETGRQTAPIELK